MLESCQVLVTGNVHFVLLKRSQCPLLLSGARKAAVPQGGQAGEVWLAQSCRNLQERTRVCWQCSDVLSLRPAALSDVCVSCTWSVTLAQAGHQSSWSPEFPVHRLEVWAASAPSESRLQWEESGAFLWHQCSSASSSQRGRMKHEFLLFCCWML